jgi:dTDP-glucose pyrophosphorylase
MPKALLPVDGVPLVQRNVELLRDQLGIRDVWIVVGYQGDQIRAFLGDGRRLGVHVHYVTNPRVDLNLPYSVRLAGAEIDRPCCMILSDECYVGSNHADMLRAADRSALVTLGVMESDVPKDIRKNYVPTIEDGRVVRLDEKPAVVRGRLLGTGTYLLHPDVFRRLADAFADIERGPRDWTSWLGGLCEQGALVRAFPLAGRYVNVNSRDDLNQANCLVRDATFASRSVSLVYLVEEEAGSAPAPILAFAEHPGVHEVVVVLRHPLPALELALRHPKVRVVTAPAPARGLGALARVGLDAAKGDVLVLAYSDATFSPRDLAKFLVYLRDADLVIGTRTTRQMIEQGTNMRGIVRTGHVALAKLVEVLWWKFDSRFTDLSCVYRALWRSTYEAIRGRLTTDDVEFFAEMVIEVLRARRRIIEIPITYHNPHPAEPYVRSRYQTANTFWRIASLLVRRRARDMRGERLAGAARRGELAAEPAPPT